AVVAGARGSAGVGRKGRVTAGQHLVSRTTDVRRDRIGKADVLHATVGVEAGVGRIPGPGNARLAGAVGRRRRVAVGDGHRPAAVVSVGCGRAGVARSGRIAAGQHLVRRTVDRRRGAV